MISTLKHAQRLVVLDETHAAHVGGEIVDVRGNLGSLSASVEPRQIELTTLDISEALEPLGERLRIDSPDVLETASTEVGDEIRPPMKPPAPATTTRPSLSTGASIEAGIVAILRIPKRAALGRAAHEDPVDRKNLV